MRRPLFAFLFVAAIVAATTAASAQTRAALQVIREDGALVLMEGGSYYRFNRDSSFDSGPIGISGRTINGRWRGGDDVFIVEGRWGWINGGSATDDYRRMTMRILRIEGPGTVRPLSLSFRGGPARVHTGYYYVDDVVRIPPPASVTRAASDAAATGYREIRISTNNMPGVARVTWRVFESSADPRCALEIEFGATLSAATLPPIQVWLLRNNGTVIAPTRAAVMTGGGFGGTGRSRTAYHYSRAIDREAAAVLVKIGQEYLFKSLR
jgi:hypothetical protein